MTIGPEITCVVPSYENVPLLARTLFSIMSQSGASVDIVVVDDSRTDQVENFVSALRKSCPHIRYFPGTRTGNPVENWNHGLAKSGADYCVLLHHDDFLIDDLYLRRALDRLKATGADMLVARHQRIGSPDRSWFPLADRLSRILRLKPWTLFLINWIGPPGCVVFSTKRAPRFDSRLFWLADVDFYVRLLHSSGPFLRDDRACVVSLRHQGQVSARIDTRRVNVQELLVLSSLPDTGVKRWQWKVALVLAHLRLFLRRRSQPATAPGTV